MDMERNIACAANAILWLWNAIITEAEAKIPDELGQTWFRNPERQAYRLALMSMVNNHLIEDFDVIKVRVKINGQWRTDRQEHEFVSTGPKQRV